MPLSYSPNNTLSVTINLDEVRSLSNVFLKVNKSAHLVSKEVKLSSNAAERDLYDSLAEIYSIIITLDGLEKAYIKDSIPEAEYTEICNRLLKQYRSTLHDDNVMREFVDMDTFKAEWEVKYEKSIAYGVA